MVSIDFNGYRYEDEPVVAVQLFVHIKNDSYKNFSEVAQRFYQEKNHNIGVDGKKIFLIDKHGHGSTIRFEKPLALFFSEEEQFQAIHNWIESMLDELIEFRKMNMNLDWKFEL